ncbi:MAG: S-layer homology domain-containing protein [Oscillospiraceae bacterium]|nr:S-layer homology domain-containing protein [Oscillospiraceae bacterium]
MKKKTISAAAAVMAAVLAFGAAAPCTSVVAEAVTSSSSAKSESAAKMEAALKIVKSRINIPEEFTEFSYSTRTEKAIEGYNFTWKAVDAAGEEQGSVEVTIMDSIITRYNVNYNNDYIGTPTLAKLSKEKIHEYAVSAVRALDPDIADQIEVSEDFSISLHGSSARIDLSRKVNGLYLGKNTGSIYINKNTGEVVSFSLNWWNDAEFEDSSKAVTEEEMEQSYKDNVKLVPSYVINRVYDDKGKVTGKTAKLIFSQDNKAVFDASTGKPTTMYDDYAKANNTANYSLYDTVEEVPVEEDCEEVVEAAPATGGGYEVTLTAAEKQALMDSGKYYSKTEAVEIITKDKYLNIGDDYVMESGVFREGNSSSGFTWQFSFYKNTEKEYRSAYVTMDAESGKIISFNKYAKSPTKTINIKTVNKIAEQAAKYYLSDIFGEYKSAESNNADANKQTSRNIIFSRYVNDIAVQDNDIIINVNSDGEVMSFSYNYDEAAFPSADIISEEKAYEKAFEQTDFRLYYDGFRRLDGKSRIYMLYTVDDFYLDAKTGKLCTSNGSPITAKEKTDGCPYTDIEGHWAEKYITTLYDYGIKLSTDSGDKFDPDEYITEREFSELLNSVFYVNAMPLMYEDYSYSKAAEYGNDKLTKAAAAKEFVLCAGGKDFAEIKGIYKSPFKDVEPTREDLGYISIAYGMGAVKADSGGNFNPEGKLTRGYAMYMIYNYLKNNS